MLAIRLPLFPYFHLVTSGDLETMKATTGYVGRSNAPRRFSLVVAFERGRQSSLEATVNGVEETLQARALQLSAYLNVFMRLPVS